MAFLHYLTRALEVAGIVVSHLAGALWSRLLGRPGMSGPIRLRTALEEMSGSFLKFGQILSLQVDTLPTAYCDALLDLLDRVPPFREEEVRRIFREELEASPEEIFLEFDFVPIAAASIGQVHRAVLRDRRKVAVKVQRPGIRDIFTRDAVLMKYFIKLIFLFRIRTLYFLRDPAKEFNDWIQDELDYRTEAHYARLLERNSRETPTEQVPCVDWELTTERILTMDFLEGKSVREYLRVRDETREEPSKVLGEIGFDPPVFVSNVIQNFVSDALRFGVFHADLHPANLLILRDNKVGYVDFGIVGHLTPEARRKIIQMTLGYVRGQNDEIFRSFMAVCELTDHADPEGFRRELEKLSPRWYREPAITGRPQFGRSLTILMIDLLTLCRSFGILPRREMIKYIRSLFLADGLVSRLAPGLDYGPHLKALCEEYIMEEAQRKMLSNRASLPAMADLAGWLQMGPGSMLRSLDMLERSELPLRVRLVDSGPADQTGHKAFWAVVAWLAILGGTVFNWETLATAPTSVPALACFGLLGAFTAWALSILWKLTH